MNGALLFGGRAVPVPFRLRNYLDDPALRLLLPEDGRRRSEGAEIDWLVFHSTKGIPGGKDKRPQVLLPGAGRAGGALATARYWSTHEERAGAHFVVDRDGTVDQLADPLSEMAYHVAVDGVNSRSVGIEIFQGSDAEFYEAALDAAVDLATFLVGLLDLPREAHFPYRGPLASFAEGAERPRFRGVLGHRDFTRNRGAGDPGDLIFLRLKERAGFSLLDFETRELAPAATLAVCPS